MKSIGAPLAALLASGCTTLARLVDVTLLTSRPLYFTDSDRDIIYNGHTYSSSMGCNPSQVRTSVGTQAESVSVDVLISQYGITSAMVEGGLLDNAKLRVLVVDYTNPISAPVFFEGFVNECQYKDQQFVTLTANPYLAQNAVLASDKFSFNCRADLGDSRCKFAIASKKSGSISISAVANGQRFTTSETNDDDFWNNGLLVFTSGQNAQDSFEVAQSKADGTIVLKGITPYLPAVGDTFELYPGCDKTVATCNSVYKNLANFRGEPFAIPPYVGSVAAAPLPPPVQEQAAAVVEQPADTKTADPATDDSGGSYNIPAGNTPFINPNSVIISG